MGSGRSVCGLGVSFLGGRWEWLVVGCVQGHGAPNMAKHIPMHTPNTPYRHSAKHANKACTNLARIRNVYEGFLVGEVGVARVRLGLDHRRKTNGPKMCSNSNNIGLNISDKDNIIIIMRMLLHRASSAPPPSSASAFSPT